MRYLDDKDPKKDKNAKAIKEITWQDFRKIVGNRWDPGMNAPFDPIASQLAERLKIEVSIISKDLENLANYLNNRKFVGSVIR